MARKCFLGFDWTRNCAAVAQANTTPVPVALPPGCFIVSHSSDTTFGSPGDAMNTLTMSQGRVGASGALGAGQWSTLVVQGGMAAAVTRSSIGDPQEIWVSFDIYLPSSGTSLDDPATNMRSEARFQIFKWGDLSLRFRRFVNNGNSTWNWTFETFNGTTSIGTIVLSNYTASQWAFVRIRARLDSGTSGRFDVTIDGVSLNSGGINSVATTTLQNATHIYVSGGLLGVTSGGSNKLFGGLDNVLIDDAEFAAGRPAGIRATIASDNTLTDWSAVSPAATVSGALTGAGTARGTGTGATALLNLGTVSTTGWESNLIGFQLVADGISNLDVLLTRKLRQGISLSGTAYNGTQLETITPPPTPSSLTPAYGMDTIFYKGGTTSFTTADITNCKPRLEVVA